MSQANVDMAYRAIDAFNRRALDDFLELMDPAVEFTPYEVMVQGGNPYRGHEGVRRWWEESFAVLPDLSAEIHEVRELGDFMFVGGRLQGHGAGSGAPIEREMWLAIEWRDGREVWWASDGSAADALDAAGLK
jgi:ketosteroid isomerase-like protein